MKTFRLIYLFLCELNFNKSMLIKLSYNFSAYTFWFKGLLHCTMLMGIKMFLLWHRCTGCLRKRYGVEDYQYFKNGYIQQCNIFTHNKYNFRLVGCELHMWNRTKVMNLRRMIGQTGLELSNHKFTHKHILIFIIQVHYDPSFLSQS